MPTNHRTTRRTLLRTTGAAGAGVALTQLTPTGALATGALPTAAGTSAGAPSGDRVAVLGGGVGGLTAAHELAERGFRVTVVEPKALGGKARSISVPGTGVGGRGDLPGEHGFRFFPGFYKNIPDTMSRIPYAGNPNGCFDNLVAGNQEVFVMADGNQIWLPPSFDRHALLQGIQDVLSALGYSAGVPANETEYVVRKMLVFVTSSQERRLGEWENVSWWEYINADAFSTAYQDFWGKGITKNLVAAKGGKASARTIALMGEAFVLSFIGEAVPLVQKLSGYASADRVLNAPTNEAWIDPWLAHLRSLGVDFMTGYRASGLAVDGRSLTGVSLEPTDGGSPTTIEADWYVAAMPAEKITPLLTSDVVAAAPSLAGVAKLETDWMNGIQFFLNRPTDAPIKGHAAYINSPWSLTSIEQQVFWNRDIAAAYGDGTVAAVLSVDISEFFADGILYGKPASECTADQIAAEVWAQLKRSLNTSADTILADDMVESWFLDPAITWPDGAGRTAANSEPLLINTLGSLAHRPEASTEIGNLFLASDYVRTNIDLATMEGANEAARAAVNALLEASGSDQPAVTIHTLWEPEELAALRATDAELYRKGLPNALDVTSAAGLPL